MSIWYQMVDLLRESMLAYAQMTHGSVAVGIMAVTFLARLALLPLTVRLARASAAHQDAMRRLQPALERARARFKNDPRGLAAETRRSFAEAGVSMLPLGGLLGGLLQVPVLLALFSAVRQCAELGGRFLWIRDISKPDAALGIVVAALTAASMAAGPQAAPENRIVLILVPAVVTLVALWQMAAGVGLYWGVSSAMGVVQGLIVRRQVSRAAA
jgi:YidC/Oxa1 family membrane protein insertase